MKKRIITKEEEQDICQKYLNVGIHAIAKEYHTNKTVIRGILELHGIQIKKKGKQPLNEAFVVSDWKIEKYPEIEGYEYIAVDKNTGYETKDVKNLGGFLTTHIENEYGIKTPTLYDRRLYYMRTGNYWWEQWFRIEKRETPKTKQCAYCGWTTEDIENRSGMYETHLRKVHGITKLEHLKNHPEDKPYFELVSPFLNRQMSDDKNDYVVCQVCGMKMATINTIHLRKHGLSKTEYMEKYGVDEMISKNLKDFCAERLKRTNMTATFHKTSKAEDDIAEFIKSLGFEVERSTRQILDGKEIDIYIPSVKVGFEYNGLYYHTENYGKSKLYHMEKTSLAESKGVRLYQIFEDEYVHKKGILFEKIRHILGKSEGIKINARDCEIKSIDKESAIEFLETYHIQGFGKYDGFYYGAFNEGNLIAVMAFIEEEPGMWNLTRFATDSRYQCRGIGGKLFKHFIRSHEYVCVKTFADRRWTSTVGSNLYEKMGFKNDGFVSPTYTLFANKSHQLIRFHRNSFKKSRIVKLFGFDKRMTTEEMLGKLGYKKIWDCGLIRYVYRNPDMQTVEEAVR